MDLDPKLGRFGHKIAVCSNFYEIWHLVQTEHANYKYGAWNRWSWLKIIDSGKFCPNTEICSNISEIWHSQEMEHANFEYNTRQSLERSRDYCIGSGWLYVVKFDSHSEHD